VCHVHNASDAPIYEVELPPPTRGGDAPGTEYFGLGSIVHRRAPQGWLASYIGSEPIEIEILDCPDGSGAAMNEACLYAPICVLLASGYECRDLVGGVDDERACLADRVEDDCSALIPLSHFG
jgi:hypothetical protein